MVDEFIKRHLKFLDTKLDKLTGELRELRKENDFNEINLKQLQIELDKLHKQLNETKHIEIKKKNHH